MKTPKFKKSRSSKEEKLSSNKGKSHFQELDHPPKFKKPSIFKKEKFHAKDSKERILDLSSFQPQVEVEVLN